MDTNIYSTRQNAVSGLRVLNLFLRMFIEGSFAEPGWSPMWEASLEPNSEKWNRGLGGWHP